LATQKHILINNLIAMFSDLEIHQQIIELAKKENEIIQTKLLKIAKLFGVSEVVINTMQYQKDQNLSKISFLYSRLKNFIERNEFFDQLIQKVYNLKKQLKTMELNHGNDCKDQSFFSMMNTTFSDPQSTMKNEKKLSISLYDEMMNSIRLATHQITDDVFYYTHDVVNYVKNMEYSNSLVYKNLNQLKLDLKKIGNFF
jgi:hypothetical protein